MTEHGARTAANVVLASAGIAAAVALVASPPLRRLARHALRYWLGASVPAYLTGAAKRAWVESSGPA